MKLIARKQNLEIESRNKRGHHLQKRKGPANTTLRKFWTMRPQKTRLSPGSRPKIRLQAGLVCQGKERKINTKIKNQRAAVGTHRRRTSRSQNTRKEKPTQLQFRIGKILCKTSRRVRLTRFLRHTNSANITRVLARTCPITLKMQDPPKFRLNNLANSTKSTK